MTKKELKWRLKDLPSAGEVAELVESKVITAEEGRTILFNEGNKDEKIKALEEQVEFLKDIIDRLSRQQQAVVWKYVQAYNPRYNWATTSYVNAANLASSLSTGTVGYTTSTSAGSNSLN